MTPVVAVPKDSIPMPARHTLMHAAGYLTTAAVAAAELLDLGLNHRFIVTEVLLAVFGGIIVFLFSGFCARNMPRFLAISVAASIAAVGVMIFGASPLYGAVLFFILCTAIAQKLSAPAAIGWCAAAVIALALTYIGRGDIGWIPNVLTMGSGLFAFTAFAVAFRRSQQARAESQQLLAELSSAQGRLRELAVMEERQRLAREMHDAVGHRLTAAAVLLEGAARLISEDPGRATHMVETSRGQVREGLAELRAAVSALREERTGTQSLTETLHALIDVFAQASDAKVSLDVQPDIADPDSDRKMVIIRTAQEALTNVRKHAAATRIEMRCAREGNTYILTCRDDGRGPFADEASPGRREGEGLGLGNLRLRAAAFGGRVDLEPGEGGGSLLRLTLPDGADNG